MIGWIIGITAIAGIGGTGLGGLVGVILKRDSQKVVSLLLGFAGGVMLAVVCFDLLEEAVNPTGLEKPELGKLLIAAAGTLIGYVVVYFLNYWIDKSTNHEVKHIDKNHPKTADDLGELYHAKHLQAHEEKHTGLFAAGVVMALAIALHNLPEGMVIGASFASSMQMFSGSGMLIAIVIGLHNIPEGMAVSVPLCAGGMNKIKSVLITAISGAPTVLGAIIGYYLGGLSALWLSLSLSFASGAMLYVVFGELLPESILIWKSKMPAFAVLAGLLTGLLIVNV